MLVWILLIASTVLGILVIRYTYTVERKRMQQEKEEMTKVMKEFSESLKKNMDEN